MSVKHKKNIYKRNYPRKLGFTIVELLVVIVVIGILAAITFVLYNGVQQRAVASVLQSDLSNGIKQLNLYQVEHDAYPIGLDYNSGIYCPYDADSVTDSQYCLKASEGVVLTYYQTQQEDGSVGYSLTAYKSGLGYRSDTGATPIALQQFTLTSISTGYGTACGINIDGKAYCWGYNSYGQIGNGTVSIISNIPQAVDTSGVLKDKTLISISASGDHTCAVDSDGKAYCWGHNNYGQLGDNTIVDKHSPVEVDVNSIDNSGLAGKNVKSISSLTYSSATGSHTCVVADDDNAYCWGYNIYGQLGDTTTTLKKVPTLVAMPNGLKVKVIARGSGQHTCAIGGDNNAYCWGYNLKGQLGNNSVVTYSSTPVAVDTSGLLFGKTVQNIVTGDYFSCAIASDSNAYCWGYNNYGQLGNGSYGSLADSRFPVAVNTVNGVSALYSKSVASIAAGGNHTCAIANDSKSYCWGLGSSSQLGYGNSTKYVPVAVDHSGTGNFSGKSILQISTGYSYSCANASDNTTYCWGSNSFNQLGNNNISDGISPSAVASPF